MKADATVVLLMQNDENKIVCGEAETAGQALDAVANLKPDLVLADITLPGRNGIELIKDICALQRGMSILVSYLNARRNALR